MEFRISLLQVGKIYRSSDKVIDHKQEVVDGYPNYYAATHTPGSTKATIVKGINTLQPVKMPGKEKSSVVQNIHVEKFFMSPCVVSPTTLAHCSRVVRQTTLGDVGSS